MDEKSEITNRIGKMEGTAASRLGTSPILRRLRITISSQRKENLRGRNNSQWRTKRASAVALTFLVTVMLIGALSASTMVVHDASALMDRSKGGSPDVPKAAGNSKPQSGGSSSGNGNSVGTLRQGLASCTIPSQITFGGRDLAPLEGSTSRLMATSGAMNQKGHIDATTRTVSTTLLGGFHGGVQLLLVDCNGVVIGQTPTHDFGVDGRWIGRSDRTDYWSEDIDPAISGRTSAIYVLHFWSPHYNAVGNIINKAVQNGEHIGDLVKEVKSIWS